jgi:hypothetical protein
MAAGGAGVTCVKNVFDVLRSGVDGEITRLPAA